MANWWETAPLVEQPSTQPAAPSTSSGGDAWWQSAPLADAPAQPAQPAAPASKLTPMQKVDRLIESKPQSPLADSVLNTAPAPRSELAPAPSVPAPTHRTIANRTQMGTGTRPVSALASSIPEPTPLERTRMRMDSALEEVLVTAPRITRSPIPTDRNAPRAALSKPRKATPSWREVLSEISPQIGARIESKIAGVKEYRGEERERQAKKLFWQAEVLPGAVQRAMQAKREGRDYSLWNDPSVQDAVKHLGIRTDQFVRDWPLYANLTPEQIDEIQREARSQIKSGYELRSEGEQRRRMAAQVAQEGRPELDEWSAKALVFDGLTSVPDLLAGIGATVAGGPVSGGAVLSGLVAPEFYAEARNRGADHRKAETYATLMTLAEIAPEVPVLELVAHTPAAQKAMRRIVGEAFADSATGQIAGTAALEGISESITEALQIAINAGVMDEKTTLRDALNDIARAGVIGTGIGAGVGAAPALTRRKDGGDIDPTVAAELAEIEEASLDDAELERRIRELETELGEGEQPPTTPAAETTQEQPAAQADTDALDLADLTAIDKNDAIAGQIKRAVELGYAKRVAPDRAELTAEGRRRLKELQTGEPVADVEVTLEGEDLRRAGEVPEPRQVDVVPSKENEGWFTILVDGQPHVEVASRKSADQIAADLRTKTETEGPETATKPPESATERDELQTRIASDEGLRTGLEEMARESGWLEVGGKLMRKSDDPSSPDYNVITGRTKWIPRADWWPDRPKGFNEQKTKDAIAKALAGEKLSKPERRLIEFLVQVHDQRTKLDDFVPTADEMPAGEETLDQWFESAMVARAAEIDEATVERLAIRYESDTIGFLKAIKAFLDDYDNKRLLESGAESQRASVEAEAVAKEETAAQARVESQEARQAVGGSRFVPDLFGQDTRAQQALADEIRRRDEKRSPNKDVPVDIGRPDDLFSQARNQVDIEDLTKQATPEVMYHGGHLQPGRAGAIYYTTDRAMAEHYAKTRGGSVTTHRPDGSKAFDYLNPAHVEAVIAIARKSPKWVDDGPTSAVDDAAGIRAGKWSTLEQDHIVDAIKKAGFNGFWTSEAGARNLALFAEPAPQRKEPTEAQKEAGNYPKRHVRAQGLEISIENEVGSVRTFTRPDGTKGERIMKDPYGYFRRTEDNTGEQVDVFLGPNLDAPTVYVIDQVIDGKFDEPKVMFGYNSEEEARQAYLRNYQRGWKGLGAITGLPIDEFKQWLKSTGPRKPLAWEDGKEQFVDAGKLSRPGESVAKTAEIREDLAVYEGKAAQQRSLLPEAGGPAPRKRAAAPGRRDIQPAADVQQLDIFASAAQPKPAARAAQLLARTRHVETGSFKTSLKRIDRWQDAAHLIAPLRKSPQEQFLAIVLDEKNRPLAVLRHTIGVVDAAQVDPLLVAGGVVRIPGAKRVYFAHNHPSGSLSPSQADEFITERTANVFEGTGIEPMGMLIVAPGTREATFFPPGGTHRTEPMTQASRRGRAVPQLERRFRKIKGLSLVVVGPQTAERAVAQSGEQSGVILLSNRNSVVGVLPMDLDEMRKLRTGLRERGAARVLSIFNEANANQAIVFGPEDEARNVTRFLQRADVRVLDWVYRDGLHWKANAGIPWFSGTTFLSEQRGTKKPALEKHREKIEAAIRDRLKNVKSAPKVHVLRRITDVPQDVKNRYDIDSLEQSRTRYIEGMHDWMKGEVYLFSDALSTPARAAWVLFHELAGHHGLRRASQQLGINVDKVRDRALDNPFVKELAVAIGKERKIKEPLRAADEALAEIAAAVRTGDYQHIQDRYGLEVPQAQRKTLRGLIARLIQAIKLALARRFGMLTNEFSDADVYELIERSWKAAQMPPLRSARPETARAFSEAPPIETEAFKRWFGDSKVVDAEGRPLVVYHGTAAAAFEAFDRDAPGTHIKLPGNFFTPDRRIAENFAQSDAFRRAHRRDPMFDPYEGQGQTIIPVYLSLQNPIEIDVGGKLVDAAVIKKALEQAERDGHDGAIIRNWPDGSGDVQYSVFRPEQIKSAIGNRGTFDPNEPSIVLSEAPAPVFYSAALRATEDAKLEKGTAQQWLGTLRNRPGVKQEELDWIGLEDWLNSLGRAATKQEVADFIRANQITVTDVIKGTPVDAKAPSERQALLEKRDELTVRLTALGYQPLTDFGGLEMWGIQGRDGDDWTYVDNTWYPDNTEAETKGTLPEDVAAVAVELGEIYEILDNEVFEDDVPNQATRYGRYTIPGGRNYRELLLTIPGESRPAMSFEEWADARGIDLSNADDVEALRDSYRRDARHFESGNVFHSSHWNEPNILAHVRFDERVDQEGKRVLFIEEIQSDWHQEGRRKGYRPTDTSGWTARPGTMRPDLYEVFDAEGRSVALSTVTVNQSPYGPTPEQAQRKAIEDVAKRGLPNAPFKTTWPELAFKRMLRWAAENGFDRIAWTTGVQQVARYPEQNRQVVDRITWETERYHDGSSNVVVRGEKGGKRTFQAIVRKDGYVLDGQPREFIGAQLEDVLGKYMASFILRGEESGAIEGQDLTIGGEGMRAFYDNILPKLAAKLTKKWGGRVSQTYLAATGDAKLLANDDAQKAAAIGAAPVHSLDITPQMRDAALSGLPLFSEAQDPRRARLERLRALRAQRLGITPGGAYVNLFQGGQPMPSMPTAVTIGTGATARTLPIPDRLIRREHIIALLERQFGVKIYQGKPFRGRMLGFFRPSNFEVRIKHKNDLEVTAHEVFHWLDYTYPELRQLYREKRFNQELRSISYDAKKLHEGFAEFGRLFLTQDAEAIKRVPQFYAAFTQKAQQLGIYDKLAKIQDRMHQWYAQGALARARSKVGVEPESLSQRLSTMADAWTNRAAAESVDWLHAAKVIERELTGTIAADAIDSPYKSLRLLAGARNTIESFLNFGTLDWTPKGLDFTGKGLKHVFEPVAHVMDDTLTYFIGRRAQELMKYGKERLFSRDEVEAMLALGENSPYAKEIKQAFDEYQAYVKRLMDFAEHSGIVSAATRRLWEQMYQNYVPFYRVSEAMGATRLTGPSVATPFKRLFGGTANLNDIWDNIVMNTATVVHASMRNMAKRQLFAAIEKSPLGQRYAVRIPTSSESVKVAMTQVEQVLRPMVAEAQARALNPNASAAEKAHYLQVAQALDVLTGTMSSTGGSELANLQEQATFFVGGQPPKIPDKDSVLVNGERVWFQIADPLLWDMLVDINYHKPIGLLETVFGAFKRTLTRGVTVTPEFQIANLFRDTINAFTMSKGGQIPFVDNLRAMYNILRESEDYKLFLANGGGFGNATPVNEGRRVRLRMNKLIGPNRKVNIRAILDTPARLLEAWDKWGQSFELATRVAEFKRIREKGFSLREAAFEGREISGDFAMHGRAGVMRAAMISLPFFNARVQGLYRMERELFERGGRQSWRGDRQVRYAMRGFLGITLPALALYFINKDDEDYQALPEETKDLYYPIKIPDSHDFLLIPKPFETGALFATVPERIWQYYETRNEKKLMDAAQFMIMQTFAFDPVPQVGRPVFEWYANKDWRGMPIVPRGLENVEQSKQYRWNTPESLVRVGRAFDVSPIALDHFLRGYFGGVGSYLTMASDSLVSSGRYGEDPAKRLQDYPVLRRFIREAPLTTTSHERDFWDLKREIDKTVNTERKIRSEYRTDDLEFYLGPAEKQVFFGLKDVTNAIAERAREINTLQISIRRDPTLSGEEKRRQIDALQQELNGLFRQVTRELSNEQLERYRDALEGKMPQASAGDTIGRLNELVRDKPRRQQIAALRGAGFTHTANLVASLPPIPDREALDFFASEMGDLNQ